jgi:hypothetical protein
LLRALLPGVALIWLPVQTGQDWAVRYTAKQLHCARFLETSHSTIQTETARRVRRQSSERRGLWQFRALPVADTIALEGWLDSLTVTRKSAETTISPDTDGLLGGRYRGTLSATGTYVGRVRPFVPDEVAEVAGMAGALDDFFPPLPGIKLESGKAWSDSRGLTIRRLPDSSLSGLPLFRFQLERRNETRSKPARTDTLAVPLRQVSVEHGVFVWHPLLGLVRRERNIVVETAVPASRAVRQPVRSKVEQRIIVARDLTGDPTRCVEGKDGGALPPSPRSAPDEALLRVKQQRSETEERHRETTEHGKIQGRGKLRRLAERMAHEVHLIGDRIGAGQEPERLGQAGGGIERSAQKEERE